MPLPRVVARLNKRYTNRFIEPVVRRFADFAVVEHVGRRSGTRYRTPVFVFPSNDAYLVALTYGPSADWAQNVLTQGGATLEHANNQITISSAAVVDRTIAWPHIPALTRGALRVLGVHEFLELRAAAI